MENKDEQGREIEKIVPLEGMRAIIAERMTRSITQFPQGTAMVEADMSNAMKYREELKAQDKKVTVGDIFVKAAACALVEVPELNGARIGQEIHYYKSVNIGMMASIKGYLMEPVVCEAQKKTVFEISEELKAAYENLKKGRLMRVALEGSTFSISNLGMFDIDGFTPLLSPPVGGMLGIGSTRTLPRFDAEGNVKAAPIATLSITTDHGLVDGAVVANFIIALKKAINDPWTYMEQVTKGE